MAPGTQTQKCRRNFQTCQTCVISWKWSKHYYFGPTWVNFCNFAQLLNNTTKKWPFYDRFRVFSYIWVKSCKFSSSRFSKFGIFTFSMAILRMSYTGNERGKWPKMGYFWPKLTKIWPKMAIFWSFFDQKLHVLTTFCEKTNAKKWAIFGQK